MPMPTTATRDAPPASRRCAVPARTASHHWSSSPGSSGDAGAVTGSREVDAQGRDAGVGEPQRPLAQAAVAAHRLPAERRAEQHGRRRERVRDALEQSRRPARRRTPGPPLRPAAGRGSCGALRADAHGAGGVERRDRRAGERGVRCTRLQHDGPLTAGLDAERVVGGPEPRRRHPHAVRQQGGARRSATAAPAGPPKVARSPVRSTGSAPRGGPAGNSKACAMSVPSGLLERRDDDVLRRGPEPVGPRRVDEPAEQGLHAALPRSVRGQLDVLRHLVHAGRAVAIERHPHARLRAAGAGRSRRGRRRRRALRRPSRCRPAPARGAGGGRPPSAHRDGRARPIRRREAGRAATARGRRRRASRRGAIRRRPPPSPRPSRCARGRGSARDRRGAARRRRRRGPRRGSGRGRPRSPSRCPRRAARRASTGGGRRRRRRSGSSASARPSGTFEKARHSAANRTPERRTSVSGRR